MMNWIVALFMAATVIFGGGAVAHASQDALPGDALYPLKTAIEQAELALATTPEEQFERHLALAQKRADEIRALALDDRSEQMLQTATEMQQHLQHAEQWALQLAQPERQKALTRVMATAQNAESMLQRAMLQAPPDAQEALAKVLQSVNRMRIRAQQRLRDTNEQAELAEEERFSSSTRTPDAERTQAHYPTRDVRHVELTGTIERIEEHAWVVDGRTVRIEKATQVPANLRVGDHVRIVAEVQEDGSLMARSIALVASGDSHTPDAADNANHDGDANHDDGGGHDDGDANHDDGSNHDDGRGD